MNGQIDMFSYLQNQKFDYTDSLASGIKQHCINWGYDWIEKLHENKTVDSFLKLFCRITIFYFFKCGGEQYGCRFDKNEKKAMIYKCGRDCGRILQEVSIENLICKL